MVLVVIMIIHREDLMVLTDHTAPMDLTEDGTLIGDEMTDIVRTAGHTHLSSQDFGRVVWFFDIIQAYLSLINKLKAGL